VLHFVLRDATFVEAFEAVKEFAARRGFTAERGFFDPGRREGLKLAFLEAAEQAPRPLDWCVQAVSSAMGVQGTLKAARELLALGRIDRPPRLLCAQQESCAPMVGAWSEGAKRIEPHHVAERPTGIAKAILRGDPSRAYPYVYQSVRESGGSFVAASESEIREARAMLEELEGLSPCFSASAALAGWIRLLRRGRVSARDTVMINLTGRDRPPSQGLGSVHWLVRDGNGWHPEDPGDERARRAWAGPDA
jgi:threonine synthase